MGEVTELSCSILKAINVSWHVDNQKRDYSVEKEHLILRNKVTNISTICHQNHEIVPFESFKFCLANITVIQE